MRKTGQEETDLQRIHQEQAAKQGPGRPFR